MSISGASGTIAIILTIIICAYLFTIIFVFIFLNKNHKDKNLYQPKVKARFLPVYGLFKIKFISWTFLPIAKRVLMGFAIGFLYGIPFAQIIVAAGICVAFGLVVFLSDSYADPLQMWTEIIMSGLTAICYLILLGFRDTVRPLEFQTDPQTQLSLTAAYICIHYLAIMVALFCYILNSLQKVKIFTFSQLTACLFKGVNADK